MDGWVNGYMEAGGLRDGFRGQSACAASVFTPQQLTTWARRSLTSLSISADRAPRSWASVR